MSVKVRVRAVIRKNNKLLLVQHRGYNTWCLPGGGVEDGESLKSALEREIREELGIEAMIGELLVVHQFKKNNIYEGPEFFFEVKNTQDFEELDIASTSHGQIEIAHAEFRDPGQTENLRPAFLAQLIEGHKEVKVVLE